MNLDHTEAINGTEPDLSGELIASTPVPNLTSKNKSRALSHLEEVDLIGKLADLKEAHYRQTLLLSAIIELLEERQLITKDEITAKAAMLDRSY